EHFGDPAINSLFGDYPVNLGEFSIAMTASVNLVRLDRRTSQIAIDLTPGHMVSTMVDFPLVQRDSFDDVEEDNLGITSLVAQAFGFFQCRAISGAPVDPSVTDLLLLQQLFHGVHGGEKFAGN